MAQLSARCPSCGAHFTIPRLNIQLIVTTATGNILVPCPNPSCGVDVRLEPASFDVISGGTRVLAGPPETRSPSTRALLEELREIARRAHSKEISPEDAVKAVERLDPRLAWVLDKFLALGLSAVATFIALVALHIQNEAYQLQKTEAEASAQFYSEALELLRRLEEDQDNIGVSSERDHPPTAKPDKKYPTAKKTSKRRRDVNKARREEIKRRRLAFPRRPHGRTPQPR